MVVVSLIHQPLHSPVRICCPHGGGGGASGIGATAAMVVVTAVVIVLATARRRMGTVLRTGRFNAARAKWHLEYIKRIHYTSDCTF